MKANRVGKKPFEKQTTDGDKTTQATVQTISASNMTQLEIDSESEQESDHEQLDMDLLLNMESDNE